MIMIKNKTETEWRIVATFALVPLTPLRHHEN